MFQLSNSPTPIYGCGFDGREKKTLMCAWDNSIPTPAVCAPVGQR